MLFHQSSKITILLLVLFPTPQVVQCQTSLGLTFDATHNICTANCNTCSSSHSPLPLQQASSDSNTSILQQLVNDTQTNSNTIKKVMNKIDSLVTSLSYLRNTTTSTVGTVNDVLLIVEEILQAQNNSINSPLPTSCQEIMERQPHSPSGVYLLATANGAVYRYCIMEELCGSGGGWTRLAYLDMSDATVNCPSGFRLYQAGAVRACGRVASNVGSCQSTQFPSNGIHYSQVCGRVVGYQHTSPDAVQNDGHHNDINSYYVDGISITRGYPRQHVWTLMGGLLEGSFTDWSNDARHNCPCSQHSLQNSTLQPFIGHHYFCESANPNTDGTWPHKFYTSDPLWDGQECRSFETQCCLAPGLPWFHRDYGNTTTTDYLELRVCGDESTSNEDTPVSFYEIYVK